MYMIGKFKMNMSGFRTDILKQQVPCFSVVWLAQALVEIFPFPECSLIVPSPEVRAISISIARN